MANGRFSDDESEHALHPQVYSRFDLGTSELYVVHIPPVEAGAPVPDRDLSTEVQYGLSPVLRYLDYPAATC